MDNTDSNNDAVVSEEEPLIPPSPLTNIVMTEALLATLVEKIRKSQSEANRELVENIVTSIKAVPQQPASAQSSSREVAPLAAGQGSFVNCTARFQGGAPNDPDALKAFIDAIEIYKEYSNIPDEHALRGLPMLLEGDAAIWWQTVKQNTSTWKDAVDSLREKFAKTTSSIVRSVTINPHYALNTPSPYGVFIQLDAQCLSTVMSSQSSSEQSDEYPLAKSHGYTIRDTFGKVQDARFSQEFNEKYQLKKGSQEYDENFRNRRVADDELNVRRKESSNKLQPLAGRRRARTLALRRDKLHNQSLRSHLHHSKMSNHD